MTALAEIEKLVIGGVLYDNATLALLPTLETVDFSTAAGRYTWDAIRNLEATSSPIDAALIAAQLERVSRYGRDMSDYLAACEAHFPLPYSTIEYARLLRDGSVKRRVMVAMANLVEQGTGENLTGGELLSMAIASLNGLDVDQPSDTKSIGDIVKQRMRDLEKIAADRASGARTLTGYPTGVERLDEHTGGWQPGIVSIVAARPGMGKSSLGLATADACSDFGFGVHLFSLEDTESSYADRSIARASRVSAEKLRNVDFTRADMGQVTNAVSVLIKRGHWIIDGRSGITADEIVRSVRRKARDNGTKVVIVDYVQLVKRRSGASSHEALTEIVTTLADAAKQDGIAYVVMSQLNREVESRTDKRPVLSDLRESGSLEERAKCVVALYRGAVYSASPDKAARESNIEWHRRIELLVLKNSNGRTGYVDATWDGATTTIK